jgi:hypothetical protein
LAPDNSEEKRLDAFFDTLDDTQIAQFTEGLIHSVAEANKIDDEAAREIVTQRLAQDYERRDIVSPIPQEDTVNTIYDTFQRLTELSSERDRVIRDLRLMDEDSFCSSALDIYAGEITQPSPTHHVSVWIQSDDNRVREELEQMLDRIKLEDMIFGIGRDVCKFGEDFVAPLYNLEEGIVALRFTDPEDVTIDTDRYLRVLGYTYNPGTAIELKPWDIVHFKTVGKNASVRKGGSVYGTSLLESSRKIWRQLRLMEDSVSVYRLEMGCRRFLYKIDVGDSTPVESMQTVRAWERAMKKRSFYNPTTGEFSARHSPLAMDLSIFWPVRKESSSDVTVIGGDGSVAAMADVEYFKSKLSACLKIPLQYLGGTDYVGSLKGMSLIDIQFARMMKRPQRGLVEGLTKLCMTHLRLKKIPFERETFKVHMTSVSSLEHQERIEALNQSLEVANLAWDLGERLSLPQSTWKVFVLRDILQLPDHAMQKLKMPAIGSLQTVDPMDRQKLEALREEWEPKLEELINDKRYTLMNRMMIENDYNRPVYIWDGELPPQSNNSICRLVESDVVKEMDEAKPTRKAETNDHA